MQFRDELITKKFPADSGFEATYRFTIEGEVPKPLCDRHRAARPVCDHVQRQAGDGRRRTQWWLDKSFGRIDIAAAAKMGENVVTIKATPFTIYHELDAGLRAGRLRA